jgi:hypothetical protein
VRDDHAPDACRQGDVADGEDLVPAEVAGRQHEAVLGDQLADGPQRRERPCLLVEDLDRGRLEPLLGQLALQGEPHRWRRSRRQVVRGPAVVGGVDGRHPDDPRAEARRDLDRHRVETAQRGVEADRADGVNTGHSGVHHARALGGRNVVRLEDEARQADLVEATRQLEVGDAALHDVGRDVDVGVVGAADDVPGPGRRGAAVRFAHRGQGYGRGTSTINEIRTEIVDNPRRRRTESAGRIPARAAGDIEGPQLGRHRDRAPVRRGPSGTGVPVREGGRAHPSLE